MPVQVERRIFANINLNAGRRADDKPRFVFMSPTPIPMNNMVFTIASLARSK